MMVTKSNVVFLENPVYPNFLCIGAQKAGTSWLYKNLKNHDEIWLPPLKEIHWFDRPDEFELPRWKRIGRPKWRKRFLRSMKSDLGHLRIRKFAWDLRYYLGRRDNAWYCSLFTPPKGMITGDFTPAYSILTREEVKGVHALLPDAKILFLLRNPIDRAWSHACMDLGKAGRLPDTTKKPEEAATEDEFILHFRGKASRLRGNYLRTLGIWEQFYPKDQFFIGFLEDIALRPREFLFGVHKFLGVETKSPTKESLAKNRVGSHNKLHLPASLGKILAELYRDDIIALQRKLGNVGDEYLAEWRDMADRLSGDGKGPVEGGDGCGETDLRAS